MAHSKMTNAQCGYADALTASTTCESDCIDIDSENQSPTKHSLAAYSYMSRLHRVFRNFAFLSGLMCSVTTASLQSRRIACTYLQQLDSSVFCNEQHEVTTGATINNQP